MTSGKKGDTDRFIKDAITVHENKYDYSLVDYRGCRELVTIICPKHGAFQQKPYAHMQGHGCPICALGAGKARCFGFGTNNSIKESKDPANKKWREMIRRCYDQKYLDEKSSYSKCSVCEEWRDYEKFKEWFYDPGNGYKDGYHLDKDILVKGNHVYSPETCCFVPQEINTLIINRRAKRGGQPIGVTLQKGRYVARMSAGDGKRLKNLGSYDTAAEAFEAYKRGKEDRIKMIAEKYYSGGRITEKVFNALLAYRIDPSD